MAWTEPKTDWKSTDYFNITDFNRLNENITKIVAYTKAFKGDFTTPMNSNITVYTGFYTAEQFNNFENAIAKCASLLNYSFTKSTFYNNGVFINATELNALELACKNMYALLLQLDAQTDGKAGMVYSGEVYA